MRVRIIKVIPTSRLEGFDVRHFHEGKAYETGRSLCEVLFAYGYAVPEEGVATTLEAVQTSQTADDQPAGRKRKLRYRAPET